MATVPSPYPAHLEFDVVLRTGRTLRVRPVRPDDREGVLAFYRGLSRQSQHDRFFDFQSAEQELRYSPVEVDYDRDFGLVGESGGKIVAIAHYFGSNRDKTLAEVAFAIADDAHGCGIGTRLLEKLAVIARQHGYGTFDAHVLENNQAMLDVFLRSGFEVKSRSDEGTVHVTFPIAETNVSTDATAARSQASAYASMRPIFAPRSVAVVGASRRRGQLGAELLHNLRTTGFRGALYAVNPNVTELEGVRSFPTLAAIPEPIDLAIISVPAALVHGVVDDAIAKGVGALVIITAGFGETGEAGRASEAELLDKIRRAGIRVVGPNCMGVINTDPAINLHATFSSVFPPVGNVAMSSQSGALGLAALDYARALNMGFSTFVSVGNKIDVSGNDLIQYWAEDPNTDVILLYLESFGDPRKFGEIARRVTRRKPIVAVKAGRSAAGAKAASSHTGALASSDAIVQDLFRQAGVIRTDTLEEMFDVAMLLSQQPLPRGRRVAIMTNAGGPGILAADACEARGLQLPELTPASVAQLRSFLPAAASVGNPVDMIASARADHYRRTLRILLDDENVDAVNVIYIPVLPTEAIEVAAAIRECAAHAKGKTVIATFMSAHNLPEPLSPVPSFPFPERAVAALARAAKYGEWRRRARGVAADVREIDAPRVRSVVERVLSRGGGWLDAPETYELCQAAALPVAEQIEAKTEEALIAAARKIGFPVAMKAVGESLLHKTEADAVRLGIANENALLEVFADFKTRLSDRMSAVLVQKMIGGGAEVMVGVTEDRTFGHVIAYGAGGTLVELMADVSFRLHPLTDVDVDDMIQNVRYSRVLRGFRGAPPADIEALKRTILRLSALIDVCPEIRELDINPLKVMQNGVIAVDARVRVEKVVPGAPSRRIEY